MNESLIFSTDFRKNPTNVNFHENPSGGQTEGRTATTELIVAVSNFVNVPKLAR